MSEKDANPIVQLPLVCTRGVIVFPDQDVFIDVGREKSTRAVDEAQEKFDSQVVLVAQRDLAVEAPEINDLYSFGTLCQIRHIRRMDGYLRVKFKGLQRVKLHTIINDDEMMSVTAEVMQDIEQDHLEEVALVRKIARQFEEIEAVSQNIPKEMINELAKGVSAARLSDQIAQIFPFSIEKRQTILETFGVNDRMILILQEMESEKELSVIENKINDKVKNRIEEIAVAEIEKRKDILVCDNIDFYSGLVYDMLGIPKDLYTLMFVIGRSVGWVAHNIENKLYSGRIIRPAGKYVGEKKEYIKMENRLSIVKSMLFL